MTGSMDMEYIHGRTGASTRASGTTASSTETASTGRPLEVSAEVAGRKESAATGWTNNRKLVINLTRNEKIRG